MSTTESKISVFTWNEFPVEADKLTLCICTGKNLGASEKLEIDKLIRYIKTIYPENIIDYHTNNTNTIINTKLQSSDEKKTLFLDIKEETTWTDNMSLYHQYLDNRGHIIVTGEYENIPNIVLTSADIIIFDTEETTNKYLTRHKSSLNNFNTTTHYILVDKRRMGFRVYGLSKSDLERY